MWWLYGVVCGCGGAVAVLVFAAGLLRLAIVLTNRIVKPAKADAPPRSGGITEWDWDEWDDTDAADDEPVRPWRAKPVIPEPGTLRAMGIMLGTTCAFTIGLILTAAMVTEMGFRMRREETRFAVAVLNLPLAALALVVMLVWSLPTGFWRAAMVTFVYGLVTLVFAAFVGLVVVAVTLR